MTYEPQRWKLDDLLAPVGTPEVEQFFADIETRLTEVEALRDQLAPDMAEDVFLDLLARLEQLYADAGRVMAYRSTYARSLWPRDLFLSLIFLVLVALLTGRDDLFNKKI